MSQASERERVILDLLNSLSDLGFDLEDCVFEWDPEIQRWIVSDTDGRSELFRQREERYSER